MSVVLCCVHKFQDKTCNTPNSTSTMTNLTQQILMQRDYELEKIKAEERKAEDPNAVDDLLTREMMKLSVKERNDTQEEIHGVRCLAIEETPDVVEKALVELAWQVDELTPAFQKKAYLQSQQPPAAEELPEHQRILHELHQLEPLPQSSYVNDVDFRLRFLRCELFDIEKSAKRMLNYLDMALELFGDYALRRPIRLSDFSKEEMRYMRKGRFQIMPNRDRSGRRISTIFPETDHLTAPPLIKAKICLYQSWAVGYKDVETQRKGHIILVWFDKTFQKKFTAEKLRYRFDALKCTRISAIHVCSPDTPYYRLRRSIAVMRSGDEDRSKLRIHLGDSVELQYALQGYGLPAEDIPISWTGKVKIKNLVQWMRIRHALENYEEYASTSNASGNSTSNNIPSLASDIVECPQPNDVLFRKGNSYVSHTGNARLRGLIIARASFDDPSSSATADNKKGDKSKDNNKYTNNTNPESVKRPKQLASEIFNERLELVSLAHGDAEKSGIGRYLIWNNKKDWWNEMTDREQICLKIEYMIRELKKSREKGKKNKLSRLRKSQKRSTETQTGQLQLPATTTADASTSTNTIKLQSATAVFRSQDGSADSVFGGGCGNQLKRQRLHNRSPFEDVHNNSDGNGSGENSSDEEFCRRNERMTECFGMRFSPCGGLGE